MSFWLRNKNKKDAAATGQEKQSPTVGTATPFSINGKAASIPSPSVTNPSQQSFYSTSARGTPSSLTSPPSSPSTINGGKGAGQGGSPVYPWSIRKFRNANPFPRFGHAANVAAGKEGEIYVFGGLVKEKRKNDLFVIDSGMDVSRLGVIVGSM